MLLLPLDKGIGISERLIHLSNYRHILLGLLYLLVSGGGQFALAFSSEATGSTLSHADYLIGQGPGSALQSVFLQEKPGGNGRPVEAQTGNKNPLSVWLDPYVPPSLAPSRIVAAETIPARRPAKFLSTLARAPPSCR